MVNTPTSNPNSVTPPENEGGSKETTAEIPIQKRDLYGARGNVGGKKKVARRKNYFQAIDQYQMTVTTTTQQQTGGTTIANITQVVDRKDSEFIEKIDEEVTKFIIDEECVKQRHEVQSKMQIFKAKWRKNKQDAMYDKYVQMRKLIGEDMINALPATTDLTGNKLFKWESLPLIEPHPIIEEIEDELDWWTGTLAPVVPSKTSK